MAIVTRFSRVTKDRVGRREEHRMRLLPCRVDGTAHLLLETCGAADRAMPGEVSRNNSGGSGSVADPAAVGGHQA